MLTIGTFTRHGNGYRGAIRTLTLNVEAQLVPHDSANDKAPNYRVFVGAIECGAAWNKTPEASRPYLSVKLDDPSFPSPLYARLIEQEDGTASLVWSRPNGE